MESTKRSADEAAAYASKRVQMESEEPPSMPTTLLSFMCCLCNSEFTEARNLKRHVTTKHGNQTFLCPTCNKTFTRKDALIRHEKRHATLYPCSQCGKVFSAKGTLISHDKSHSKPTVPKHLESIPLALTGDPVPKIDPRQPPSATCPPSSCRSALNGAVTRHRIDGTNQDVDLSDFLKRLNHKILLREAVAKKKSIKFWVSVIMKLIRPKNWLTRGDQESFPYFTSRCSRVFEVTDINLLLETAYAKVAEDLARWLKEGSGWIVDHVNFVDLTIITYKPLK